MSRPSFAERCPARFPDGHAVLVDDPYWPHAGLHRGTVIGAEWRFSKWWYQVRFEDTGKVAGFGAGRVTGAGDGSA